MNAVRPLKPLYQPDRACAGTDTESFFPDAGGRSTNNAKAICRICPYTQDCLDYALEAGEHGVWGGTDENERRAIRRERLTPYANHRTDTIPEQANSRAAQATWHTLRDE